jgi:nucleotide-binding universal stress UspA family protein
MFKRILFPTDGSPSIDRGVLYATHLARLEQDAELIVFHVCQPPTDYISYPGYEQLLDQLQGVGGALVDEVVQQFLQDGIVARGELRLGSPADMIIAVVEEYDIDLVLMGSSGRRNRGDVTGSVSLQVMRQVRCPVMLIP